MRELVKKHFDHVADEYASRMESHPWKLLKEYEARHVRRSLPKRVFNRSLDLGSGTGFYAERILQNISREVSCVDASAKMLSWIKIDGVRKIAVDVETFESDERWDLILCSGLLEFIEDTEKFLGKVKSLLSNDGLFVLLVPVHSAGGLIYRRFHRKHGVEARLFSRNSLKSNLEAIGFRVLKSSRVPPINTLFVCEPR